MVILREGILEIVLFVDGLEVMIVLQMRFIVDGSGCYMIRAILLSQILS